MHAQCLLRALHHLPFQHFIRFLSPLSLSAWNVPRQTSSSPKIWFNINMEFVSWTARRFLVYAVGVWALLPAKTHRKTCHKKNRISDSSFCKLNCDGCQEYFRSFHFAIFTIATRLDFVKQKMCTTIFEKFLFSFRVRLNVLKGWTYKILVFPLDFIQDLGK